MPFSVIRHDMRQYSPCVVILYITKVYPEALMQLRPLHITLRRCAANIADAAVIP